MKTKTHINRITIGRVYSLGNYENIRYEISAEVAPGESAAKTLIALERIVCLLAPERQAGVQSEQQIRCLLNRVKLLRSDLRKMGAEKFKQTHGFFEGTPREYITRCSDSVAKDMAKRQKWQKNAAKARAALDRLGGTIQRKDAKLDWEFDDEPQY